MRLIGLYYACLSVFIILFAAPLGSWIDQSPRLRAALACLFMQNLCVALSGACFLVILQSPDTMLELVWLEPLLLCGAIAAAGVAGVASSGSQTCLTRDWLVEVAALDHSLLARSNSVIRAIDLSTEVLSPAAAGYVMAVLSVSAGAAVVVARNIVSLGLEAVLYVRVWQLCPQLQQPKEKVLDACSTGRPQGGPAQRWRGRVGEVWASWRAYMAHEVRPAGLALAFLYMTVLAFDNYSRAYLYEAGLNEALLGLLTSVSSVPGLIGSLLFPLLRRKMGLEGAGVLGFGWQTAWLTLCVASVFAPGSLFYLAPHNQKSTPEQEGSFVNSTVWSDDPLPTSIGPLVHNVTLVDDVTNRTSIGDQLPADARGESYCSVALLLTGIIMSRFGLWTADLAVVQSMQELVAPQERGALGGVQSALNMAFDLLRSLLLIAWPRMDTFGFLIILSFVCVLVGFLNYCQFYVQRQRARRTTETPMPASPSVV